MKIKMSVYVVWLAVTLSSATASTPVRDSNGDEVRAGEKYMMYYVNSPGRFYYYLNLLPSNENNTCPLDVYPFPHVGLPLTFHPEEGDLVRLSEDVNIKFETTTPCEESTVLQVVRDKSIDREYVSIGGVLGNQLSASWFRFEPREAAFGAYQLKYCARNFTTSECSTVGLSFDSPRLVVLKENVFRSIVVIAKAPATRLSSVV